MASDETEHREQSAQDMRAVISAVEHSPFACSALDDDRRFLAISEGGLAQLAPLTREEVIGKTLYEIVSPGQIKEPEDAFDEALRTGRSFTALTINHPDGSSTEFNRVITANVVPGVHVALALDLPLAGGIATANGTGIPVVVCAPDDLAILNTQGAVTQTGVATVVATCTDPGQLSAMVLGHRPAVTVIATSPFATPSDAPQPEHLIETVEELVAFARANSIETGILTINHQDRPDVARSLLRAGALGVFGPTDSADNLGRAIRDVADGSPYMSAPLALTLATHPGATPSDMSPREIEILRLLALGYTNQQVADELFLSVRTVENHRANLSRKLGSPQRKDLVRYALDHQLIP